MTASSKDQGEWYIIDCGRTQFRLPVRYRDLVHIEESGFDVVVRATDTKTGKYVAIKKIIRPFQTSRHAKRTYQEFKLLMDLNHPDAQVVQFYNVYTPEKNLNDFQTLYFVLQYADCELYQVIRRCLTFTENHIKFIIYSLLRGLKFIHSAGFIHNALSSGNIRIDKKSDITIFGFDVAYGAADSDYPRYTQMRSCCAPELIFCNRQYRDKVDMWSAGCIMAELILLRPLFHGRDHIDHLNKLFDIIGTPDLTVLNDICTPDMTAYISRCPPKPRKDYNELFGFKYDPVTHTPISGVSSEGIDFLDHLLSFDHRTRPTAEEALAHPFMEGWHDPTDEPTTETIVDEHQSAQYSIAEWKSIIWQMIEEFVPPPWVNDVHDDDADD